MGGVPGRTPRSACKRPGVFWKSGASGTIKPLLSPPAAYGLFVALGFSERLLEGLTKRLEDQALKQEDQGKEKPKGDGKEGQGKPQDQQPKQ